MMLTTAKKFEHLTVSIQNFEMQSVQTESSENDCCRQDCGCNSGLQSHVALGAISMLPNANFRSPKPNNVDIVLKTLIVKQVQRSPKTHLVS
jgi:hypothetical protein